MTEQKAPKIDMSKVANIKAIEAEDPQFAAKIKSVPNNKTSKFKFTDPERIKLPSGGRLYSNITADEDILNGYILMYPMTVKEEEILTTGRFLRSGIAIRMVLDNCIASDIAAKDLLVFDSNFILFYLRQISYGDEYKFGIKCESCKKKFKHTVSISEIKFEELDKNITEPIEVKLPRSKYTVQLVLPRNYHAELIFQKRNDAKDMDADNRLVTNLLSTTIGIFSPQGEEIQRKEWEEFFTALPAIDRAELAEASDYSTGIDEIKNLPCPYCGEEQDISIPTGMEFFRF